MEVHVIEASNTERARADQSGPIADGEGRNLPDEMLRAQTGQDARISHYANVGDQYWGTPGTASALEGGFYSCGADTRGFVLRRIPTKTDGLLRLPCPISDLLLSEFVTFWENQQRMRQLNLSVKRGILLYGPPGGGKTSTLNLMADHMVRSMGGVVIMATQPDVTAGCLQLFRRIEPTRPLICIYEDFDAMVQRYGEAEYLALLDGELQVDGVINIATTNYPENLDPRITNRPGRFDRIALVGMPLAEAREAYFRAKLPDISEERLALWLSASDGWSMAHLRELVVGTEVLGEEDGAVIERLSGMIEALPKSDDHRTESVGFGRERGRGKLQPAYLGNSPR